MARRCDRCRTEYESGAEHGGHDYCMTCYVRIMQEERAKRAREESMARQARESASREGLAAQRADGREQLLGLMRRDLHAQYKREAEKRNTLRHQSALEAERQDAINLARRREATMESIRKKRRWHDKKKGFAVEGTEPIQIFAPLLKKKKPLARAQDKPKKDGRATYAAMLPQAKEALKPQSKKEEEKQPSLSLLADSGLPVSLSLGQKQIEVFLTGKNASTSPSSVSLVASVSDALKNQIACRAEPRVCTIPPEGEQKFKVGFDIPEDAAKGRLELAASIKENAVYIGRLSAHSETVALSSQVKTPMELSYRKGSAAFADGALALLFDNNGESGGILETSSYASWEGAGGKQFRAGLSQRTKLKGGERGIRLVFSPAAPGALARLEASLAGKDSNGKPYSLKARLDAAPGQGKKGKRKEA